MNITKEIQEMLPQKKSNTTILKKIGLVNCANMIGEGDFPDDSIYFTEMQIRGFASKHNLQIRDISNFTGTIPERCVTDIEKYLKKYPDEKYTKVKVFRKANRHDYGTDYYDERELTFKTMKIRNPLLSYYWKIEGETEEEGFVKVKTKKEYVERLGRDKSRTFYIVAPAPDMISNDPAIFEVLEHNSKRIYRLVTSWGEEDLHIANELS